jgi:hypothetical protein
VVEFNPNEHTDIPEIDGNTGDTIIRRRLVMDYAFNAEYEVLQNVYNEVGSDTVAFEAYDHYGRPGFEKYEYVLLYLSKYSSGTFYQQKYQFDPLINKGGRFSGENGESTKRLFKQRTKTVFKARNIFK